MPCANHPEAVETARCAQCSKSLCANCTVVLEGRPLCGPCKQEAVRRVERGDVLDTAGRGPSPWEEKASFRSLFRTVKLALLSPKDFFGGLRQEGKGYWSFLIALGWPAMALGVLLGRVLGLDGAPEGQGAIFAGVAVGMLVLAPLQLMIGVAIGAGVLHLFLRMFGAARGKLETTLRTYIYAQSTQVFGWIPVLGPVVSMVWMPVILVIGLKHMHNTSYGRVIAAVCLPLAVLVGLLIMGLVAAFAAKNGVAPS